MSDHSSRPPRRINFWATVCVALVCATIAYLVPQFLQREAAPIARPRLWHPVVVTPDGRDTILSASTRRLEFWTPSVRTKDFVAQENGTVRDRDKWEIIPSDAPVQQFGVLLRTNANVLGYRRAEVWGHGRTSLKPGWWWTLTVTPAYNVQSLHHAYRGFWKSTNAVYVEITENPSEE